MKYLLLSLSLAAVALAVPPTVTPSPKASIEAEDAAKRATVPAGMTVSLWASEPMMANPVAFCFDEQGRAYVAESTRFDKGVPDTRSHMYWLDDDIGARTVADRLAMYRRHKYGDFTAYDDQIRRIWDSTGKGVADKVTIFAKGFNKPEDGLIAGVLARKGDVFVTNIPSLYKMRDTDGDGVADARDVMSTGYGVRVQFLGHDLHGLRVGPDGRLYFSIGDRGFTVTTKEGKTLSNPDSGAVLRCEMDGSNLEIIHIGLRNPQELAFDDYGNLFTYDNNCDSGDRARWVQIVPGGDSGWRCGYQYGTLFHTPAVKQGNRGPWNTENIWHLEGGPAYVVPPLAHFGNGPAGITHYPGLGLPEKYKDHFFASDFTSNPGSSVIWSLAVKPKGASFEVVNLEPFVKNMVPTDCEFGPDCNFYWSDWVGGWNPPGKGRIFKVTDAEEQKNPAIKEAQELMAGGIAQQRNEPLCMLLQHPHQQVRQEAQFHIIERGNPDTPRWFLAVLSVTKMPAAKLHCVWGLGQYYRKTKQDPVALAGLLADPEPLVRAHAARTLAESATGWGHHYEAILKLLKDPEPQVRVKAAYALALLFKSMEVPKDVHAPIMAFADASGNDPYLRHAAIVLLSSYDKGHVDNLLFAPGKLSTNQKLVLAVALRRIGGAAAELRLAEMLNDADPAVVIEAARAIYDTRMEAVLPALAKFSDKSRLTEAVAFRALAANFLIGDAESAKRLAAFAARKSEPDYLRSTALKLLADWPKPPRRDPITGLTIALKERDVQVVKDALKPVLDDVFAGGDALRKEAVTSVRKLGIKDVGAILSGLVADAKQTEETRVDALCALADLKAKELDIALPIASRAAEPKLKATARTLRVKQNPKVAEEFPAILNDVKTSTVEKQMILAVLGTLPESASVDAVIGEWLEKLIRGDVPAELKLEIIEAAEARANSKKLKTHFDFRKKLAEYDRLIRKAAGKKTDMRFPETLSGGDAAQGRLVFLNNAAVSCQRCHKLDGEGGDVGPPVNGIGKEKTRDYLLEAIILPDAHIAEGFKSVILELSDGRKVSGVLRNRTKEKYTLLSPENKVMEIAVDDVESEKPDKSAMPEDVYKKLTRREMRDLVEFLASLKTK